MCRKAKAGWKYDDIMEEDAKREGTKVQKMSKSAISRALEADRRWGDAAGCGGKTIYKHHTKCSLSVVHKMLILSALALCCTVSTRELGDSLRAAEATARTSFPHPSIDAFIRSAGITRKKATVYNARRDPMECARARVAIRQFPVECLIVVDASHIAADAAQRKYGRSARGRPALTSNFTCSGMRLVSVLGAFTIDGFELEACDVVVRAPPAGRPAGPPARPGPPAAPPRPPATCPWRLRQAAPCSVPADTGSACTCAERLDRQ